jgi:hypothetical protein
VFPARPAARILEALEIGRILFQMGQQPWLLEYFTTLSRYRQVSYSSWVKEEYQQNASRLDNESYNAQPRMTMATSVKQTTAEIAKFRDHEPRDSKTDPATRRTMKGWQCPSTPGMAQRARV